MRDVCGVVTQEKRVWSSLAMPPACVFMCVFVVCSCGGLCLCLLCNIISDIISAADPARMEDGSRFQSSNGGLMEGT